MDRSGVAGSYDTATFTRALDASPVLTSPADGAVLDYPNDAALVPVGAVRRRQDLRAAGRRRPGLHRRGGGRDHHRTRRTARSTRRRSTPRSTGGCGRSRPTTSTPSGRTPTRTRCRGTRPRRMTLVTPPSSNAVPIEKVVLSWAPVRGAAFYQLDLSPDQNFNDPIYDDAKVVGNTFTPKATLPAGAYYWRVRPMSTSSVAQPGEWSDVDTGSPWTFTKAWPASAPTPRRVPRAPRTRGSTRCACWLPSTLTSGSTSRSSAGRRSAVPRTTSCRSVRTPTSPRCTFLSCFTDHTRLTPFERIGASATVLAQAYISPGRRPLLAGAGRRRGPGRARRIQRGAQLTSTTRPTSCRPAPPTGHP